MTAAATTPRPSHTSIGRDREAQAAALYRPARDHVALPSPEAVDDAAVEAFHRDGFIAVENVFSQQEVDALRASITDTVRRDAAGDLPGGVIHYEPGVGGDDLDAMSLEARELAVRKLWAFVDVVPALAAAADHANLKGIAEKLQGEPVRLFQDMALLKPPGGGVEKPWHQDTAYFRLSTPLAVIGTWTALDAVDADNGCMHVVPASHKGGPRPHYHDRDCQLPDDAIPRDEVVAVPLRPGGAMFFSGLVHHGTPPNLSDRRRRALQFHYLAESGLRTEDPAVLTSLFNDRGGFAGCQGWADKGLRQRPIHLRADF